MSRSFRPAFSMTGLLVLLGLLLFFLALLFPALHQVQRAAARSNSSNNLRQIGLSIHNYHDVHRGMPPTVGKGKDTSGTVHFHILPYLEQEPLYRKGREDWTQVAGVGLAVFLDPDDKTTPADGTHQGWLATTNYAANWLVFRDGDVNLAGIPDGTSNTIMFSQRYQVCGDVPTAWAYNRLHYRAPMFAFYSRARFQSMPTKEQCDPGLPQSLSEAGILVGLADGSVRFVSPSCSPKTWSVASDPSDGLVLEEDFN